MTFHYEAIDHVQLAVPFNGEGQAVEFYQNVLGFQEIEKPASLKQNGGVWFRAGDVHIHIGIEKHFTPARKAHPAIRVKDLEQMKDYLRLKQVVFHVDEKLPGANRFYVFDPFGNRIEFLEWV